MGAHRLGRYLCAAAVLLLNACVRAQPAQITIIDGDTVRVARSAERVPLLILREAEIPLGPEDRVLVNGLPALIDQRLDGSDGYTVQLFRPVRITLVTPDGEESFNSSALPCPETCTGGWLPS